MEAIDTTKNQCKFTDEQLSVLGIIKNSTGEKNEDFLNAIIKTAKTNKNYILAERMANNVNMLMDRRRKI